MVLGYGNPGRQDDGFGPVMATEIGALGLPGVQTDSAYQLNIEDAATLAACDLAVFIDASVDAKEPFSFDRLGPDAQIAFTSHSVSPGSVLAMCQDHFETMPETWLLGIRGYDFDFIEGFTDEGAENWYAALSHLKSFLENACEE